MTGAMKLQPDDGLRSSLGIGPSSDDAVGSRRSSLGDSPKESGSSLGTRREITRRMEDSLQEYQRLPDWWERFIEGIGMLVGNTSGDRSKKTIRLTTRIPEVIGFAG
ncbi:hypothetical protein B296_00002871, partial [Ensete ventricosum]